MELQQLRYFCAIADTGSFTRAAEQTHVSQPSLSQQIRKLEDELGARLFDRLGRAIQLTELGRSFLPRARAILRDLEAARSDVVERKLSISGPISIGVFRRSPLIFCRLSWPRFPGNTPRRTSLLRKKLRRYCSKDFERERWTSRLLPFHWKPGVTISKHSP